MTRRTEDDFARDVAAQTSSELVGTSEVPSEKLGTSRSIQGNESSELGTSEVPNDAERRGQIKAKGLEALARLKTNRTYEDWRATGEALLIITEETLNALGLPLDGWDPENKQLTKEFTRRFEAWELSGGSNLKLLTKQERWALRELMTDQKYHDWYIIQDSQTHLRLNYPNAIIKSYKAKHRVPGTGKRPARPSIKQWFEENTKLQAEIADLQADRDNGDQFKATDTAKDIAKAMMGRFPGDKGKRIIAEWQQLLKRREPKP